MINWTDINLLNKQKLDLQIQLNELLNSDSKSVDKINELKSEIIYLDKQISKILGTNELKRLEELKNKKNSKEQANIKAFYELKNKYKKISKIKLATSRMIAIIEALDNQKSHEIEKAKVRI